MMNKKGKIVWILYMAILVFLFLLSSTDLIIKEQKHEVYRLSVIVEDSRDDNYINFRKGMDQAAMDLNADVSFITLYEKNSFKQQVELMERERQDGAQALVVSPVDDVSLVKALQDNPFPLPLVFFNSDLAGAPVAASVSPDYIHMGSQIAEQIKSRYEITTPVYLFGECERSRIAHLFEYGISSELRRAGFEVILYGVDPEKDYRMLMEELIYPGCRHSVIVALDQAALVETAAVLGERDAYTSYVKGLYGRGTSLQILNYVDRGLIDGVCISDDFAAGYRCVSSAVDLISRHSVHTDSVVQESYYIEKEDLRKKEFEKMLYPIE